MGHEVLPEGLAGARQAAPAQQVRGLDHRRRQHHAAARADLEGEAAALAVDAAGDGDGAALLDHDALDAGVGKDAGAALGGADQQADGGALLGVVGTAVHAAPAAAAPALAAADGAVLDAGALGAQSHQAVGARGQFRRHLAHEELRFELPVGVVEPVRGQPLAEAVLPVPAVEDALRQAPDDGRVDGGGAADAAALQDRDRGPSQRRHMAAVAEVAAHGLLGDDAVLFAGEGRPLLQHHHGMTGPRQHPRRRAAAGAAADHDEVRLGDGHAVPGGVEEAGRAHGRGPGSPRS